VKAASPHDLVDTYQCGTRVRLGKAGAHRSDPPSKLIVDLGLKHEALVVSALEALTALNRPKGVFSAASDELTDSIGAHLATPDGELAGIPDLLLGPAGLEALGLDATGAVLEPVDAKLARTSKEAAVLQVAVYGEVLARLGYPRPKRGHLLLGREEQGRAWAVESHDLVVLYPLVNRLLESWKRTHQAGPGEYGERRPACEGCIFKSHCEAGREEARDLTLVARISSSSRRKLGAAGVKTVEELSELGTPVAGVPARTQARLVAQAKLLVASKEAGEVLTRWAGVSTGSERGPEGMLEPRLDEAGVPVPNQGPRLPRPHPGDWFFDFEGYPHAPRGGLEYLWGWSTRDGGFHYIWCDDEASEARALEAWVDAARAHLSANPGAHVYHYAPYEQTMLKRTAHKYGTRVREVHELIESGALVDLYAVVTSSLLVGASSYSIKVLEKLYRGKREGDVQGSLASVEAYAKYLDAETPELAQEVKDSVLSYNADDCYSTQGLYDWLEARRGDAALEVVEAPEPEAREAGEKTQARREEITALEEALGGSTWADLMALLVGYYERERSFYWSELARKRAMSAADLAEDEKLVVVTGVTQTKEKSRKSRGTSWCELEVVVARDLGDKPLTLVGAVTGSVTPATPEQRGEEGLTERPGHMWVSANPSKLEGAFSETTLLVKGLVEPGAKAEVVLELARRTLLGTLGEEARAVRSVLERGRSARLEGHADPVAGTVESVLAMPAGSWLAVQGPPGAGKSYLSGEVVEAAKGLGWQVAVSAVSRKAYQNVLEVISARGFDTLEHASAAKKEVKDGTLSIVAWANGVDGDGAVLGGTAFGLAALARAVLAGDAEPVDLLVIDEASQMPLVDLVALAPAARRVLLLGDPSQLPHVSQASHDESVNVSVLGHLVAGASVLEDRHGFFLDSTRRMPEEIAEVVSMLAYDGRLRAHPSTSGRSVGGRCGLFSLELTHLDNATRSVEEASLAADLVEELVGSLVAGLGPGRLLEAKDVMVVVPYNDQLKLVEAELSARGLEARVGTVDKFQGQEAPVVLYSMTASGDEGGRGAGFVLATERLNVAISRAQVLALVLGASGLTTGGAGLEALNAAGRAALVLGAPRWEGVLEAPGASPEEASA
jgi:uncharacterized protein